MDKRFSVKSNGDFRRIFSKGKNSVTPYMVVYYRKNRLGTRRAGFTVSAKLGNAVTRNRVKRKLREIVRLNGNLLRTGVDIVVVARSRSVGAPYRVLEREFLDACGKLNLFAVPDGKAVPEEEK